ncbi:hypothetical protein [Zobellia sp. B3R18]|uniref:hypothetical protein n=1 Tax=Zobellia sp. B3R18 TaxID=2841568 RepID=UPI001C06E73A|nr:hypothetical protein [Zobellia sp. B3R18]MBU2973276.1 hypothetical protein [Zobellia sp. B3R18]
MRLAAVFIEKRDNKYGGYTLNFGGHFNYKVKFGDGKTRISRRRNENYINNFFDSTNTVTNVSAIVGSNGSGKTTTIYEVLRLLNKDFKPGFAFWEEGDTCYFNHYNFNIPPPILEGDWKVKLEQISQQVGTIYYSPYLDYKLEASGIDISADRYLREDLVNIDSTYDANNKIIISERLKRADYKRFINFQKSKFSRKITEKYGLFNDDLYRVVFTRHRIDSDTTNGLNFENTPRDFRNFLNELFLKIRHEDKSLNRNVSSKKERFELNKMQFKNILLMDIFCLLIKLMERQNIFLEEGHFDDEEELNNFLKTNPDAISQLKFWLNNYNFSKGNLHPLPNEEVISILNFLYEYIDEIEYSNADSYFSWSSKSLFFDEDKLDKLLDLNENLLVALNKYYLQEKINERHAFQSMSDLQHFANPEYAQRRLSSGETALLNLYSRIYDYFSRHILNYPVVNKESYYILFLDEADLGYHPIWKKSFVKSIIEFSRDFFKTLESKVQIVFTTHDAISLSDIPNSNVTYLQSGGEDRILSHDSPLRPKTTFAANVNDLLGHSFFLDNLLIGDFANSKIEYVIKWINENRNKENDYNPDEFSDIKKVISLIEEPVLRNKLAEMLSDIELDSDFIAKMIEKQTDYLNDILKKN